MKIKYTFIIIILVCLVEIISAQTKKVSVLERQVQTETLSYKLFNVYNPALQLHRQTGTLSDMQFFSYHRKEKEKPFATHLGDEEKLLGFSTNSFYNIKNNFAMWGMVEYNRIHIDNSRGNSVEDYELLYPQIQLTTAILEKKMKEQYKLKGGIAKRWNRLTLGFEMDYLAYHSVVRKDPRPQSITGDVTFLTGSAFRINKAQIHLGCSFRRYKQDYSFININDGNKYSAQIMQGPLYIDAELGSPIRSYLPYKGTEKGVFGGVAMLGDKGINITAGFRESSIARIFNEVNFRQNASRINCKHTDINFSSHTNIGKHSFGIQLEGNYKHKNLTAYMIYPDPVLINKSNLAGEVKTWFSDEYDAKVRLLYNVDIPKWLKVDLSSYLGIYQFNEKLLMPLQTTSNKKQLLGGALTLRKTIKQKHKIILDVGCEFAKDKGHELEINIPIHGQRDKFRPIKQFRYSEELIFKQNFDHRVSDTKLFSAGVKYAYSLQSYYAIYLYSRVEQFHFVNNMKQNRLRVALGLDF